MPSDGTSPPGGSPPDRVDDAPRSSAAELETLAEELRCAQLDLALKDDFALQLRAAARRSEEEAEQLRVALADCQTALAAANAELSEARAAAERLAAVEAELAVVTSTAGYRLVTGMRRRLERYGPVRRAATSVARRLAPGR